MVTAVSRQRIESPERRVKALERALAAGVEPLQIAGTGEWVVTSASKLGTVYRTDGFACECEAALHGDPCCVHRAVVLFVLGRLSLPEPTTLTAMPASIPCPTCFGKGWDYVGDGYHWPDQVACRRCQGSGRLPVVIRSVAPHASALAAD